MSLSVALTISLYLSIYLAAYPNIHTNAFPTPHSIWFGFPSDSQESPPIFGRPRSDFPRFSTDPRSIPLRPLSLNNGRRDSSLVTRPFNSRLLWSNIKRRAKFPEKMYSEYFASNYGSIASNMFIIMPLNKHSDNIILSLVPLPRFFWSLMENLIRFCRSFFSRFGLRAIFAFFSLAFFRSVN